MFWGWGHVLGRCWVFSEHLIPCSGREHQACPAYTGWRNSQWLSIPDEARAFVKGDVCLGPSGWFRGTNGKS